MKPLLVGEMNPYGSDPSFALYPLPEYASGGRLAKIMGMTRSEYLSAFDRVNLCTGQWALWKAREAATAIQGQGQRRVTILLGRKVADAFFLKSAEPLTRQGWFILLPHPSGRCLAWNDPVAVSQARDLVRYALAEAAT